MNLSAPQAADHEIAGPQQQDTMGCSTAAPSSPSSPPLRGINRLYNLPPELRNHIYRYLVPSGTLIRPPSSITPIHATFALALPAVDRRTHIEAGSIFYGENIFAAIDTATAERWLIGLGEDSLKAVRSLRAFHKTAAAATTRIAKEEWRELLREKVERLVAYGGKGVLQESAVLIPLAVGETLVWTTVDGLDGFEKLGGRSFILLQDARFSKE
ncbi:hypothetical protein LTR85_005324 [Meristemomyces frigidus]|nr:hypothetical protein LTR85_005324 [Meristemomyces frigidus]